MTFTAGLAVGLLALIVLLSLPALAQRPTNRRKDRP